MPGSRFLKVHGAKGLLVWWWRTRRSGSNWSAVARPGFGTVAAMVVAEAGGDGDSGVEVWAVGCWGCRAWRWAGGGRARGGRGMAKCGMHMGGRGAGAGRRTGRAVRGRWAGGGRARFLYGMGWVECMTVSDCCEMEIQP